MNETPSFNCGRVAEGAEMQEINNAKKKGPARAVVPSEAKILVSRDEAAQLLSISRRSIDYLVANRRLATRRIGARLLIPVADLRRFARGDHPERIDL